MTFEIETIIVIKEAVSVWNDEIESIFDVIIFFRFDRLEFFFLRCVNWYFSINSFKTYAKMMKFVMTIVMTIVMRSIMTSIETKTIVRAVETRTMIWTLKCWRTLLRSLNNLRFTSQFLTNLLNSTQTAHLFDIDVTQQDTWLTTHKTQRLMTILYSLRILFVVVIWNFFLVNFLFELVWMLSFVDDSRFYRTINMIFQIKISNCSFCDLWELFTIESIRFDFYLIFIYHLIRLFLKMWTYHDSNNVEMNRVKCQRNEMTR